MNERCLLLMRRACDQRVLLIDDPPRLPSVAAPAVWFPAAVEGVAAAGHRLVGGPIQVLRLLLEDDVRVWELEVVAPPERTPPGHRWAPPAETSHVAALGTRHREVLRAWVREFEHPESTSSLAPWQRAGWLRDVRSWIRRQNERLRSASDLSTTGVRGAWPASCVVRVRAGRSTWYFKATPAASVAESSLIRALSPAWAHSLPEVVAEAPKRRWMLMRALPARTPGAVGWSELESVLALLARLQAETVSRLETTPFSALPEWRLDDLSRDISEAVERARDWNLRLAPPKARGEAAALAHLPERVDSVARRLARLEIPDALIHTDFHPGNFGWRRGRPVLLDWAEASRGHPFFAATRLFDYLALQRDRNSRHGQLVEAYLRPWRRYLPVEEAREAFNLALRLHPARQAVRWRRARETSLPDSPWRRVVEGAFSRELSRCLRR